MRVLMKPMIVRRVIAILAIAVIGLFGAIILAEERYQNGGGQDSGLHTRLDARDRETAGQWYREHLGNLPAGFRLEDRLTPSWESALRVGEILRSDLRGRTLPVPADLLQKLPLPPRAYRYLVLDGHLLIVEEKTWNVSDVLHFELDFGRP
jgi:hypothetical protein